MEILQVEDNEDDVILTRQSVRAAGLLVNLHAVEDGEQCMAFLRKQPPFGNAPTADLVLLDLNLPVMDGREVLTVINDDEALRHVPVIVLTTSAAQTDILEVYKLRCNAYIVKPVKFERFVQVIATLESHRLSTVTLPDHRGTPNAGQNPRHPDTGPGI